MLSVWVRPGLAVSALAFLTTPVWADTFQVNPSAIGAPQASFTAGLADFSYTATVNQTGPRRSLRIVPRDVPDQLSE